MDLFAIDSWNSDKVTDSLNNSLFGEVHLPEPTTSSNRSETKTTKASKKKTKNKVQKASERLPSKKIEAEKTLKGRKRSNDATGDQATSPVPEKRKKHKKSNTNAEVVDTKYGENESSGFTDFLGGEVNQDKKPLSKKKRKSSSKKNKFKHLDELRKFQQTKESNAGSKVDIDIQAKLAYGLQSGQKDYNGDVGDSTLKKKADMDDLETEKTWTKKVKVKNSRNNLTKKPDMTQQKNYPKISIKREKAKENSETKQSISEDNTQRKKINLTKRAKSHKDSLPSKKAKQNSAEAEVELTKEKNQTRNKARKCPFDANQLKAALVQNKSTPIDTTVGGLKRPKPQKKLSLKDKMMEQLNAARFRYLNEQLYTIRGDEALTLMQEDDSAFEVYHQGFQQQVEKWPENPVDRMIAYIRKRPDHIVADFGCGDAKIAESVKNRVHSFDLVACNENVTACDMANVPLKDKSVDIAVFCLSLMGTNVAEFLAEAHRVLKKGGNLLIAEVVSRFENTKKFIRKVERMGFTLLSDDLDNKMFLWFELKKTREIKGELPALELAPCVYKKR